MNMEADNDGWIKVYRKILDNPVVCRDADHLAIWILLLTEATHKKREVWFNNTTITLNNGQLVTGRKYISDKLKINESKVQRTLKCFENEHQIKQQTTSKNRLITIINWGEYQNSGKSKVQNNVIERMPMIQQSNIYTDDKNSTDLNTFFENVWILYPNKKGKQRVTPKSKKELMKLGYEVIKKCVERYTTDKPEWQHWQNGNTFFNSGYFDYLDGNYEICQPYINKNMGSFETDKLEKLFLRPDKP